MSLSTWIEEFYPIPANECEPDNISLLKHALKKWKGLTKSNLKNIISNNTNIGGSPVLSEPTNEITDNLPNLNPSTTLSINADTCSLCQIYHQNYCVDCPLAVRNNYDKYEACLDEYLQFQRYRNPKPMIKLIEKILKEYMGKPNE